jgi:DNA-binding NtrC family response regulator
MTLPPLRARREDIPDLARSFLAALRGRGGQAPARHRAEALALLVRYDWPGNVRQLENALFRAVVLADGDELTRAEFPQIAARSRASSCASRRPRPSPTARRRRCARIVRVEVRDPHAISLVDESGDMRKLEELEAEIIPLRAAALPRPHVGGVAPARHRRSTLYVSSRIWGSPPRERRTRRDFFAANER